MIMVSNSKRKKLYFLLAAILSGLIVGTFFFLNAGKLLTINPGTPQKADAIVVLGGGVGARSVTGLDIYRLGYSQNILLTGVEHMDSQLTDYYLNWRAVFFLEAGVPRENILFDSISGNSWEEAQNTLRLMKEKGWQTVIVVSDPPHMRRLKSVWAHIFSDSGKKCILIPSSPTWWDAANWWKNEKSAKFVISEYIKILFYSIAH